MIGSPHTPFYFVLSLCYIIWKVFQLYPQSHVILLVILEKNKLTSRVVSFPWCFHFHFYNIIFSFLWIICSLSFLQTFSTILNIFLMFSACPVPVYLYFILHDKEFSQTPGYSWLLKSKTLKSFLESLCAWVWLADKCVSLWGKNSGVDCSVFCPYLKGWRQENWIPFDHFFIPCLQFILLNAVSGI